MYRATEGALLTDLASGTDEQIRAVARIIQVNNPDVVLLNEVDYDATGQVLDLLRRKYLEVPQNGSTPVFYPYAFTAPVNTGVPSGLDLDGDGRTDGPGDAWGFGAFPGQFGMLVLSRFPILTDQVRTFQNLRWSQMPGNLLPEGYYSPQAAGVLRLSSKSHWDVPVRMGWRTLHVLVAHPTPPAFDGPEKRNARRNHDEIRFWADYLTPGEQSEWIVDDAGRRGGLGDAERFVILGDYNADPVKGDSWPGAISQLLLHPRVQDPKPVSAGAAEAAERIAKEKPELRSAIPRGDAPALADPAALSCESDTADFSDEEGMGTLRVDYVLPSSNLTVASSGVFWPAAGTPGAELVAVGPAVSSDHRLVRVDLDISPR